MEPVIGSQRSGCLPVILNSGTLFVLYRFGWKGSKFLHFPTYDAHNECCYLLAIDNREYNL